ncbi:amidase [Kineobactrum sediminis]|uniref:Amidase n=1 Tax=Kineobactrum sediminis TaxID=1905677 RepID=A0A2N5Y731_9GAMM|nr:amidase [Kineobactrum sediminis]PLW84200.1 amidase [Kineobactrum sediminis]
MQHLLYRSAFAIARDIKAGVVSSVDVLAFFLDRVAQFNGELNAVIALDEGRARTRAEAADAAAAKGEDWGPLHGVPMTIKDAWCTEGLVTVGGIPECHDQVPANNAVAVQRYIDAGAIIFGKTNVPFMSADLQTFNDVYGTTNNPWNRARTCGGSSGGAAAALAAGLTPLELGSDIGGSIRTPSHFNGVFGHKSSYGIVPLQGHLPPGEDVLSEPDLSVAGPLATCVDDLEQALDVLAGPSPPNATGWRLALPAPDFADISSLRVAIWADDPFCPVDSEVLRCVNLVAGTLQHLGAQVDLDARPAISPEANHHNYVQLLMAAMAPEMPASVREMAQAAVAEADPSDMAEPMLQLRGLALSHSEWLRQNEIREQTRATWARFFEDFDVLICPCAHVPAFAHDHLPDMQARTLWVNGMERPYTDILRWAGLSLNAYLPATAVPAGITLDGLPVGVQIVARYLGDRTSLAVARLLEQHHRAFTAPPGYTQ